MTLRTYPLAVSSNFQEQMKQWDILIKFEIYNITPERDKCTAESVYSGMWILDNPLSYRHERVAYACLRSLAGVRGIFAKRIRNYSDRMTEGKPQVLEERGLQR